MPVILGLLTTLVTILIHLNRLAEAGISLGGLNPFLWHRRRKWKQQVSGNPIFRIESPMDLTALLMIATAKVDGDISSEEKSQILKAFTDEMNLSKKEAAALMVSSVYLYGDGRDFAAKLDKVLAPALPNFSEAQARSALQLLDGPCRPGCSNPELKRERVERVRSALEKPFAAKGKWG